MLNYALVLIDQTLSRLRTRAERHPTRDTPPRRDRIRKDPETLLEISYTRTPRMTRVFYRKQAFWDEELSDLRGNGEFLDHF